ncbi:hypothetical protein [Hoylesella shahii]|uniref:DUF7666 domain-containing protein n=1 Tax=Hoylesella shahii TaxID=228603 RepID=UPI0028ED4644|nr:hypothetical protein [Hoylesella shahii]
METKNKIQAYKGFNNDLTCRDFQYEVGKEYEQKGKIEVCENGFHACENPMDVFGYYPPSRSRYCEVEQSGIIGRSQDKIASSKIRIQCEIGLSGLINAGVKFILDKVNWKDDNATNTGDFSAATNTGNCSAATNTGDFSAATNTGEFSAATNTGDHSAATNKGDRSAATNTGYLSVATNTGYLSVATNTGNCSAATNTGYYSAATNIGDRSVATNTGGYSVATNTGNCSVAKVEGKESIAIVTGRGSKACGALGCWLVLTERNACDVIIEVKAVRVDGEKIKPNTWYKLENGQIIETE